MNKTDKRILYIAGLITESEYYNESNDNWVNFKGDVLDFSKNHFIMDITHPQLPDRSYRAWYDKNKIEIELWEEDKNYKSYKIDTSKITDLLNKYNIPFNIDDSYIVFDSKYVDFPKKDPNDPYELNEENESNSNLPEYIKAKFYLYGYFEDPHKILAYSKEPKITDEFMEQHFPICDKGTIFQLDSEEGYIDELTENSFDPSFYKANKQYFEITTGF